MDEDGLKVETEDYDPYEDWEEYNTLEIEEDEHLNEE